NGAVLVSELNKLIAEQLKIDKQLLDTEATQLNIINSLAVLTGLKLNSLTIFQVPEKQTYVSSTIPQLKIFSAQEIINQASLEMEFRNKFPKLSLFANGGYGRPGYNFMDTDLHPYGMVGLNLSWNIIDWGTYNKQKEKSLIKQKVINVNKQIFLKQNTLEIEKLKIDLLNIQSQIEIDAQIITIKEEIKNSSWSKFKNGTITSNDYLKDFNDLKIAQQTLEINRIKFIQKEISLKHLQGVKY
ncbi:MAG: TolC family protein, partial [Bacteroidota bacterium]